jgi:hypothetical protein
VVEAVEALGVTGQARELLAVLFLLRLFWIWFLVLTL